MTLTFVEISSNATEFSQFVFLELLGERDVVEVVEGIDGRSQALVVFLVDQQPVQCLVDRLVVEALHRAQVRLHELQVAGFREEVDASRVVHSRRQHQEHVVQQQGLEVEIELDRLVVQLDVGHLRDDVLEVALAPGLGRVRHHGEHCVVVLLVLVVEEHQLAPQVRGFGSSQDLRDVDARPEQLEVLAHLRRLVFRVENRQLGEHSHVSAFESERRLQQADELFEVAAILKVRFII